MAGTCTVEVEQTGFDPAEAEVLVTIRSFDGFKGYVNMVYEGTPTPTYITPSAESVYIPQNGSKVQTVLIGHSGDLTFTAYCSWSGGSTQASTEIS